MSLEGMDKDLNNIVKFKKYSQLIMKIMVE